LTEIEPGAFTGLSNLRKLVLSGSKIKVIEPGAFASLSKLTFLDLRGSTLEKLNAECFQGLGNLEELFLNYSEELGEIDEPRVFFGLSNLKSMHLDRRVQLLKPNLFYQDILKFK
jgi:Leucine-rich repeat (LRR) protein